jgi:hypothetical protein
MKKLFALMLALVLVFSMSLSSLAAVADYGDADDTPDPVVAGEDATSDTVVGGSAEAPAAYVPPSFIQDLTPVAPAPAPGATITAPPAPPAPVATVTTSTGTTVSTGLVSAATPIAPVAITTPVGTAAAAAATAVTANVTVTVPAASVTATSTAITNAAVNTANAVVAAGGTEASANAAAAAAAAVMVRAVNAVAPVIAGTAAAPAVAPAAPSIVHVTSGATLPAAAMTNISQSAAPVVFVSPSYSIAIAPVSVTQARDVSLNLGLMATSTSLQIRPAMRGSFGMTMDVAIPVPTSVRMNAPRLFYVPAVGPPQDRGPVRISGGTAIFSINSASAYVIADSMDGAVASAVTTTANVTTNINPATGAAV